MMQLNNSDEPRTLAAIDLGSNSFHMIVARVQNGQLQLLDRLREPVRLAEGLTREHDLKPEVAARAIDCLQRFGQRVRDLPADSVRAVGTNTLRRAQASTGFTEQAQNALGHPIEIISGIEEARLVYLGVAHSLSDPGGRRLVVDIGGGSTELIIGEEFNAVWLESLYMGCVGMTQRFFSDGSITKAAMKKAILAARLELQPVRHTFRRLGWTVATGSSGTIRTVRDVVREAGWSESGITADSLKKLRAQLIACGSADAINYPAVNPDRKPVFAGGVAILSAVFQSLKIEQMLHSSGALREGAVYDLLGRIQHRDVREATIQALTQRYQVDAPQAARVEATALKLLEQVQQTWKLRSEDSRQWLRWASLLHEAGRIIAHSQYHRHGAYLVEHSDLPGFSVRDQRFLATLLVSHRRKFRSAPFDVLPKPMRTIAVRLCILLRLSVLLHRGRSEKTGPVPELEISEKHSMHLQFPPDWLDEHPLTRADLEVEKKYLKNQDFQLKFT